MAGDEHVKDYYDGSLWSAEKQAAEDRAFEENPYGTGGDPDASGEYDYDAGAVATDIDYQPGDNGISDEFTNYNDTDAYARQFGNYYAEDEGVDDYDEYEYDDDDDDDDEDDDDVEDWDDNWADEYDVAVSGGGPVTSRGGTRRGGYQEPDPDQVGQRATVGDIGGNVVYANMPAMQKDKSRFRDGTIVRVEDSGRKRKDKDGEEKPIPITFRASRNKNTGAVSLTVVPNGTEYSDNQKQSKENSKRNAKIPWKPGDQITLELLNKVWFEFHKLKNIEVQGLIDKANQALETLMQTFSTGSMLVQYVKMYDQLRQWTGRTRSDFIGTVLQMASRTGVRNTLTVVSTVGALFMQDWEDPLLIATLPKVVERVLVMPVIRNVLNLLFRVAVPILEGQETNENDKAEFNFIQ